MSISLFLKAVFGDCLILEPSIGIKPDLRLPFPWFLVLPLGGLSLPDVAGARTQANDGHWYLALGLLVAGQSYSPCQVAKLLELVQCWYTKERNMVEITLGTMTVFSPSYDFLSRSRQHMPAVFCLWSGVGFGYIEEHLQTSSCFMLSICQSVILLSI
ncbi:hypothetical protein Tco_1080610 [Tanacetum coccineum]|uniref:Uncharacterized protein n=1 Tax=Tanacetum coccineum TaxID=301880 RepID=A0ABQ5HV90_9ASTR